MRSRGVRVIQGEGIGARQARPKFRRIERSKMSVFVLLTLGVLLGANLIRLSYGGTTITSALSSASDSAPAQSTTKQPNIEVQTYAPTSTPSTAAPQDAATLLAASTPAPTPATTQAPKDCTGSQYALPAPQDLSSAPLGLTKTIDQPTYYQVYGSSLPALRTAIANCAYRKAATQYHASTAYQLNWRYSAVSVGNNQCKLTNIRVGMHINLLMPTFVPTSGTPASVASAWSTYAANLATHENGHVAIDAEYAERLLAALQSMGPLDCSLISRQAQTTIDSYVAMLNAANDLYDSHTNHGATQGAVL